MLNILMIEDDEADFILIKRAFNREGVKSNIQAFADGNEAVRYLLGEGDYSQRGQYPFPNLVFVDLHMPTMTGFELLEWRKNHAKYSILPFMVISASDRPEDIQKSYLLGANAYFVKPSSLAELQRSARVIHDFWTSCAKPQLK